MYFLRNTSASTPGHTSNPAANAAPSEAPRRRGAGAGGSEEDVADGTAADGSSADGAEETESGPALPESTEPLAAGSVASLRWRAPRSAVCGETARLEVTLEEVPDGDPITVLVKRGGTTVATLEGRAARNALEVSWTIGELAARTESYEFTAEAGGVSTTSPLEVTAIPGQLPETPFVEGRTHFDLAARDFDVLIGSTIKWYPGWAASVVALGAAAPPGRAGAVAAFNVSGGPWWWMKSIANTPHYWNGTAWTALPDGFRLQDSNNFCVGFYKNGSQWRAQYGGDWPEQFPDWDAAASNHTSVIASWRSEIRERWTGRLTFRRTDCASRDAACCRYTSSADVTFDRLRSFETGSLIVAPGNIRANDSLFFLGESRSGVAAHEFGHHLGNPDEYEGAAVDRGLNDDGASNGIDANSIMGQNLTTVKSRHGRTMARHLGSMASRASGRRLSFVASRA